MIRPLISICVPVYNGSGNIKTLLQTLLKSSRVNFEIIAVDDCSTDDSWECLSNLARVEARLRCDRNVVTLGMDRNFDRVASLAAGDYIWFCGQDDVIESDGLDQVIDLLLERPSLDFILMTHSRRVINRLGEYVVEEDRLDQHVFGSGIGTYLIHTDFRLPTFLPKFCMRRDLWLKGDPSFYFGTHYCQVGVFLEVARNIEWCHFSGNYVTGLEPIDGWQVNVTSYVNIAFGYLSMLVRAAAHATWIDAGIMSRLIKIQRRRLIFASLLLRHHRIRVDQACWEDAWGRVLLNKEVSIPALLPLQMPRKFSSILIYFIELRRKIRTFFRVWHFRISKSI